MKKESVNFGAKNPLANSFRSAVSLWVVIVVKYTRRVNCKSIAFDRTVKQHV